MATIQPVPKEVEVDFISAENEHENPPTQNTDSDSLMIVTVEKPNPVSEPATELPVTRNEQGSFLTSYMATTNPVLLRFRIVLLVCSVPVVYTLVTIVTFAILPLVLVAFVVLRLVQFVIRCDVLEQHYALKVLMRYWVLVVALLLLIEVGLFYPIAKFVPVVNLVTIIGLPITMWIKLICIVIGIYFINLIIWFSTAVILAGQMVDRNGECWELVLEAVSEIFGCLLFLWAEVVVMNSVPTFKQSKIFGIYTHKWIKVSLFVLIGYNMITLLTHIVVWSLPKLFDDNLRIGEKLKTALSLVCCYDLGKGAFNKKYVVYVGIGIKRSIIFIFSAVMLFVTWVLYFDKHLNTRENKRILKFGTWTLVSLLTCSFFWLIKSCIILYWEAHTVYNRLHSKTADIGRQLYFLILLSNVHFERVFETPEENSDDSPGCGSSKTPPKRKALWVVLESGSDGDVYQIFDRKTVREKLISRIGTNASIHDIHQAAEQILAAQYSLSKENTSDYLRHLQSDTSEDNGEDITETLKKIVLGEIYSDEDWKMLLELLPSVHPTEQIYFQEVKTWMERAHSRCRFLANTLLSEKEVGKCLNQVISGLIIAATFIMWLLLSGLAKTNVLVLIASPFLAATFIFGDTCKSLFQGLIFVYVVHPFDVGDLCVVDDNLFEVKRIGVWCTTFSKVRTVGKQQEVIYPNSALATKNVINHKTEFDWNDQISFSLKSVDKGKTENLKQQIESYLDTEKHRFTPHFHSVEFLETEDKAKIVVHVKHNIKAEGWTYFECLKEKEKRRFETAIHIHDLINQEVPEAETQESSVNQDEEASKGG
ncbi:hypothetical protein RND81_04G243200 [Saponaria officinalis]|uniref:Mechanosensitive ion channel MscS domain-containing protein n=1 Tax=Saponaria officinalis TaxID=3572 RepID=A0AAW1LP52_SAPOF